MTFGEILPHLIAGKRARFGRVETEYLGASREYVQLSGLPLNVLELVDEYIDADGGLTRLIRPLALSRRLLTRNDWELVDAKGKEK